MAKLNQTVQKIISAPQVKKNLLAQGIDPVAGSPDDLRKLGIRDVMHANPRTIGAGQLAAEAAQLMEQHRITQLLVADGDRKLVGALNMHDLMRSKVI